MRSLAEGHDSPMVRLLGIDPGLRFTGWGLLEVDGNRLRHLADGVIATDGSESVPDRLRMLHDALLAPTLLGIPVSEYGAKTVKLSVVGTGGASKDQVQMMVRRLLPGGAIR